MCRFTLFTRLVVIAVGLLFVPCLHAEPNCDSPIKPYLEGNSIPSIVKIDGDLRALPLGSNLRFTMPSSVIRKDATKIIVCIRWKTTALEDKEFIYKNINPAIKAQTDKAFYKIQYLNQQVAVVPDNQPEGYIAISAIARQALNAAKESSEAAVGVDSTVKLEDVFKLIDKTAETTNQLYQALNDATPKPSTDIINAAKEANSETKISTTEAKRHRDFLDVWTKYIPIRVLKSESDVSLLNVTLPDAIHPTLSGNNPFERLNPFWPTAEVRIIASDDADKTILDTTLDLKISSDVFAALVALATSICFWALFYLISDRLGHQGGLILKVIANRSGYASLSQFQITLWTMIIAGSVIYVMVLSEQLIDIKTTTLWLLGISGFSVVAGKIQRTTPDSPDLTTQDTTTQIQAPGVVTDLQVCGKPGDTQLVLAWKAPKGGGKPSKYKIEYADNAGLSVSKEMTSSFFEVSGLTASTKYNFTVKACNAIGDGAGTSCVGETAATPPGGAASAAPNMVSGLITAKTSIKQDQFLVQWSELSGTDCYVLEYRAAGNETWLVAEVVSGDKSQSFLTALAPNTAYEFRVFGVKDGIRGEVSLPATAWTAIRTPRWSDLIEAEGGGEVDVARIQMFYFTLIAAVFVLLKVASSNEIPDIPEGMLLLMGISNGVYLTAKFTPNNR